MEAYKKPTPLKQHFTACCRLHYCSSTGVTEIKEGNHSSVFIDAHRIQHQVCTLQQMAALFTFDEATLQNFAHLAYYIKSIKLTQQLHERALYLSVCTGALTEPPPTNCINLIHEDDAWLMLLCIAKHLPDQSCALSNVLVHYCAGHNLCEAGCNEYISGGQHDNMSTGCNGYVQHHTTKASLQMEIT